MNQSAEELCKRYARAVMDIPVLSSEEEYICAKDWREKQNKKALDRLVSSHLRLVMKVAQGYRGYGLPISELIAEGNVGILQATNNFDPEKGVKFSTYSTWWIRASMQEYVLKSWSLVKMGTTTAQRKLFFGLRKIKRALDLEDNSSYLTNEKIQTIAEKLEVKPEEVVDMHNRFAAKDSSLNTPMSMASESESEWIEWVSDDSESHEDVILEQDEHSRKNKLFEQAILTLSDRERYIISERRLKEEPKTLEEIAQELGLSRERVRQLEVQTFDKLKKAVKNLSFEQNIHF
jgi:RNA polymerase sigma-32 factor